MSYSNFIHNMARNIKNITANYECSQQYDGAGGAIIIRRMSSLYIYDIADCVFHRNSASIGGAIFGGPVSGVKNTVSINSSNFTENTALNCGGALSLNVYKNITFYKSIFYANSAVIGGALNLKKATSSVIHCIFQENEANMGGAIHCSMYTIFECNKNLLTRKQSCS